MDKEYGRLTLDQFRQIVQELPELRSQIRELPQVVRTVPKEKIEKILDEDFYWADVYELPFVEQIALLFIALGKVKKLVEISNEPDPQQALLNWSIGDDLENWNGGEGGFFDKKHVIGLTVALQRNVLSICLYHRSLASLVEEVKTGNDESFFLAVRVDRSILACPAFADRLAKAELLNDKAFFLRLRSALKGPSKKHWEAYHDLRYAIAILREMGFDQLSDAQLEDLFVHKLRLYPNVPGARKNLRKQMYEARKISTTLK